MKLLTPFAVHALLFLLTVTVMRMKYLNMQCIHLDRFSSRSFNLINKIIGTF